MNSGEAQMTKQPTLLALLDSPTVNTGFAHVGKNLLKRWAPHFSKIDIWGVNYFGWPHDLPYRIYPAGSHDWNGPFKLQLLLEQLSSGKYTHFFVLMDPHQFMIGDFPEVLGKTCKQFGIHFTFYYPVDSALEPKWLDVVAVADEAVVYNQYGYDETAKARKDIKPKIIPHGADFEYYYPREDRMSLRERIFHGWADDETMVMINVNRNERRKAPQHSLQILKGMIDSGCKTKLIMHCPNVNAQEGTNLELIGRQLGLVYQRDWIHTNDKFENGNGLLTEEQLNEFYNAADMCISTSTAEGWGLSLSCSAASGCRVAAPMHTGCQDVINGFISRGCADQFIPLPTSDQCIVNATDYSRVRYPVDVPRAVSILTEAYAQWRDGDLPDRFQISDEVREWLSWNRIAKEFLKLMKVA